MVLPKELSAKQWAAPMQAETQDILNQALVLISHEPLINVMG